VRGVQAKGGGLMPIRPSERAKYPRDWPEISWRIRDRAGWRCECTGQCGESHQIPCLDQLECGAPNGDLIIRDKSEPRWFERHTPCSGCVGGDPECARAIKVVLTVAHLDHDPTNNDERNLLACCQRCHLRIDRHEHVKNARATRRSRKAARELFE